MSNQPLPELPKNHSWFYTVTWNEGSIFRYEEFGSMAEALDYFNNVKRITWQTKASNLRIVRYGNFVMDFTPI